MHLMHQLSLHTHAAANHAATAQGDSHGARCLPRPYSLLQQPSEVTLELPLPFWVMPEEDLQVG
jgi:hypothetical protein